MAKIVDITEKLSFDEKPKIKIKDTVVEVNDDAITVLKAMGILSGDGDPNFEEAYELLFEESDRDKIKEMKLNFIDWLKVIEEAIDMLQGDHEGEAETHTTI